MKIVTYDFRRTIFDILHNIIFNFVHILIHIIIIRTFHNNYQRFLLALSQYCLIKKVEMCVSKYFFNYDRKKY